MNRNNLNRKGTWTTAVDMPVRRNNLFLTVSSEKLDWEHFSLIGTVERGPFVPERIKEEPVVPFD